MKWISVIDALPDAKKKVLLYCKAIGIITGYYWDQDMIMNLQIPVKGGV